MTIEDSIAADAVGKNVKCAHDDGECDPATCDRTYPRAARISLIDDGYYLTVRLHIDGADGEDDHTITVKADNSYRLHSFYKAVLAGYAE